MTYVLKYHSNNFHFLTTSFEDFSISFQNEPELNDDLHAFMIEKMIKKDIWTGWSLIKMKNKLGLSWAKLKFR